MHSDPRPREAVSRVVLPSGRSVEVVYVEERALGARPDSETHIYVCGSCESHLVQELDRWQLAAGWWQMTLRCPECEWSGTGAFDAGAVERFDDEVERGRRALVGELERVDREAFAVQAQRFIGALRAGLVAPEDF